MNQLITVYQLIDDASRFDVVSISRFGDHPTLTLGASVIAVGDRYLPAWAPASSHWPNLFLNGAHLLALRVPAGSVPDGVTDGPSADTACRTRKAGPQRHSLDARRLRRGFATGSPPDNSSASIARMESALRLPWLAVNGSLQGRTVQTKPAHVATSPTIPPAEWLPATLVVAPTENIRVLRRWSPCAILLAPIRVNIQCGVQCVSTS